RDAGGIPPAEGAATTAPDLGRRPHARRRRAPARDRAQLLEVARARGQEAADPSRLHGRERLLRVLDAHLVELRARGQTALRRHDVDQGRRLVGRPPLIPRGIEAMGCEISYEIGSIAAADVVYILRMQRERMQEGANYVPSLREYTARWGVTPERLRPGQKVMHPGPMNRGVEID